MRIRLLKKHEPSALNFFELRRTKVPPPWFEYINIPMRYNLEASITKWITENLKGRFYVGKSVMLTDGGNIDTVLKIGFEEPKECSYFTLACPHLKYN